MEQFTSLVDRFILGLAEILVKIWQPGIVIIAIVWAVLAAVAYILRRKIILIEFDKNAVSIISLDSGRREEFEPELEVQELKKRESKEWRLHPRFSNLQRINPFLHPRCPFIDTEIAGWTLGIFLSKYLGNPLFFYRPPMVLSPIGYQLEGLTPYELSEIQRIGKLAGGRNPVIYFGSRITSYDDISSSPEEYWYPGKPKWT